MGQDLSLRETRRSNPNSSAKKRAKTSTFQPLVYASPTARRDRVVMGEMFKRVLMPTPANSNREYVNCDRSRSCKNAALSAAEVDEMPAMTNASKRIQPVF